MSQIDQKTDSSYIISLEDMEGVGRELPRLCALSEHRYQAIMVFGTNPCGVTKSRKLRMTQILLLS